MLCSVGLPQKALKEGSWAAVGISELVVSGLETRLSEKAQTFSVWVQAYLSTLYFLLLFFTLFFIFIFHFPPDTESISEGRRAAIWQKKKKIFNDLLGDG